MSGEKPLTMAWETHGTGQAMVLSIRGEGQFTTSLGKTMYKQINSLLHIKDLAQKRASTRATISEPTDLYETQQSHDAARLIEKVTILQNTGWSLVEELSSSGTGANNQISRMLQFLQDAIDVDHQLQDWKDWAPNQWRPSTTPNFQASPSTTAAAAATTNSTTTTPAVAAIEYPKRIHLFQDPSIAGIWCSLRAARVRLLQAMLECTRVLAAEGVQPSSPAFSWSVLHTQLLDTVDSICNSVPYLLGETDESGQLCIPPHPKPGIAFFALWPLHVVARVTDVDDAYFDWILEQLCRVGEIVGCKRAVELENYSMLRGLEYIGSSQRPR
jgi:hypothetical protein